MALPSKIRTWQYNVNQRFAASGDRSVDCKNVVLAVKRSLCEFATNPWTVVASSNGLASAGAADYWGTSISNLNWYAGANWLTSTRSWIVLRQPGTGLQILLDLTHPAYSTANESICYGFVSPSVGFTGGSLTSRPTASDEIMIMDGNANFGANGNWPVYLPSVSFTEVVHVMHSEDGKSTRLVIGKDGKSPCLWIIDEAVSVPVVGTMPVVGLKNPTATTVVSVATYGFWNDVAQIRGRHSSVPGTAFSAYMTTEGYVAGCVGERLALVANEISGEWPMTPVGLVSENVGIRGRLGALVDIWFGSTFHGEGTTYPGDGSKTFAQFGHIVLPWNGTTPLLS